MEVIYSWFRERRHSRHAQQRHVDCILVQPRRFTTREASLVFSFDVTQTMVSCIWFSYYSVSAVWFKVPELQDFKRLNNGWQCFLFIQLTQELNPPVQLAVLTTSASFVSINNIIKCKALCLVWKLSGSVCPDRKCLLVCLTWRLKRPPSPQGLRKNYLSMSTPNLLHCPDQGKSDVIWQNINDDAYLPLFIVWGTHSIMLLLCRRLRRRWQFSGINKTCWQLVRCLMDSYLSRLCRPPECYFLPLLVGIWKLMSYRQLSVRLVIIMP